MWNKWRVQRQRWFQAIKKQLFVHQNFILFSCFFPNLILDIIFGGVQASIYAQKRDFDPMFDFPEGQNPPRGRASAARGVSGRWALPEQHPTCAAPYLHCTPLAKQLFFQAHFCGFCSGRCPENAQKGGGFGMTAESKIQWTFYFFSHRFVHRKVNCCSMSFDLLFDSLFNYLSMICSSLLWHQFCMHCPCLSAPSTTRNLLHENSGARGLTFCKQLAEVKIESGIEVRANLVSWKNSAKCVA